MNADERYQLVDNFLQGRLRENDLAAFEQALLTDDLLKQELAMHQLANTLVINKRLLEVEKISLDTQVKASQHDALKKWGIGAWLFIALVATGLFFTTNQEIPTPTVSTPVPTTTIVDSTPSDTTPTIKNSASSTQQVEKQQKKYIQTYATNPPLLPPSQPTEELSNSTSEVVVSTPHKVPLTTTPLPDHSPQKASTVQDVCKEVVLSAAISTQPACANEMTGGINVHDIKGGHSPYVIEVFSHENEKLTHTYHLLAGSYLVYIKDAQNCVSKPYNILIKEKVCEEEFSFNPFLGEAWELEAVESEGNLVIHTKTGEIHFQKHIAAGERIHWEGNSSKGSVDAGYFAYEIHYKNGLTKRGTITVTK